MKIKPRVFVVAYIAWLYMLLVLADQYPAFVVIAGVITLMPVLILLLILVSF